MFRRDRAFPEEGTDGTGRLAVEVRSQDDPPAPVLVGEAFHPAEESGDLSELDVWEDPVRGDVRRGDHNWVLCGTILEEGY